MKVPSEERRQLGGQAARRDSGPAIGGLMAWKAVTVAAAGGYHLLQQFDHEDWLALTREADPQRDPPSSWHCCSGAFAASSSGRGHRPGLRKLVKSSLIVDFAA